MNDRLERWTPIAGWLTLILMLVALYGALILSPPEQMLGDAFRIFYFHVPSAWSAYLAFTVVFVASIAYLLTRSRHWDVLALSSAELGVVFTTLALITGSLWAKSFWGIWWTWGDMRLTLTLFLWFLYVAYLMLRAYTEPGPQQARLSAVIAVVGVPVIVMNHFAVRIWRTQHPSPVVLREGGPAIEPIMIVVLVISLIAFTVMYIYLLANRVRLERTRIALRSAQEQLSA
ncbi:MAG: cytochrome c biogenesis protein [Anaerolineae bacterium]